ncbi:MAG: methyltransferase domain-containing protein [Anaerolineae bacterium]|nr:methyltransferase domain-containing protein [Anaerolineae bacterium]MDW8102577.1 methyltransferase domain-containing protein [Anaerolineae bacterium]
MPDLFSWIAPLYDRIISSPVREKLSWIDLGREGLVIDVGGGTGRVARVLKSEAKVIVVDPSFGMLVRAKGKGLMACCARAEALPFAPGVADAAIVVDAFHHFEDHLQAAKELMRVLKKGGKLFLEEPDITNFAVKVIALGERLLLMRSRFYDFKALVSFFLALDGHLLWAQKRGGFLRLTIKKGR